MAGVSVDDGSQAGSREGCGPGLMGRRLHLWVDVQWANRQILMWGDRGRARLLSKDY